MLQWLADRGPGFVSADYSVWQVNVLPVPVQVLLWELPLCVMVHPGISWKLKFEFPVGIKKNCFSLLFLVHAKSNIQVPWYLERSIKVQAYPLHWSLHGLPQR